MKGFIFDIKRFALNDGPGIRTTVFFKGCPLDCAWCHNPESRLSMPEHTIRRRRIGDRVFERQDSIGSYYDLESLLDVIVEDEAFYRQSGGGVTFSGGEPLAQTDFLVEILQFCRKYNIHTAVDTSGYVDQGSLRRVLPHTNLFLYDIKHLDDELHRKYTGVSNADILTNLQYLLDAGAVVEIRIPVIPGVNDDEKHLLELKAYLQDIRCPNLKATRLLPYHNMASSKYNRYKSDKIDRVFSEPTKTQMDNVLKIFENSEINISI